MVAQYAICSLRDAPEIFVVVLQSDLIDAQGALVAAPLVPVNAVKRIPRLNPVVQYRGQEYLLIVNKLGAVPAQELSRPMGSSESQHDAISNALDYLFKGF